MKLSPLAVACVLCACAAALHAQSAANRSIAVNGEAVVNVTPDKIVLTLGIETWNLDIGIAKRENNDIVKKAITILKAKGVSDRDIQTDHLSIEPRWKSDYRKEDFIGYFVRNTLVATLRDPAHVEGAVTDLLAGGVNYIHGIDFQTTELKKYREQARELALGAAKEKAEKMAAALGQSIGEPLTIADNNYGSSWWYPSSWWGWSGSGRAMNMSQNVVQDMRGGGAESSPESIALGKISVRANVAVTFEMKSR